MHVLAKRLTERRMQQMRGGVIALRVAPPRGRHARHDGPEVERPLERTDRGDAAIDLLDVIDRHAPPVAHDLTYVRYLAARLRIERRLTQDDRDASRLLEPAHRDHLRLDLDRLVAHE